MSLTFSKSQQAVISALVTEDIVTRRQICQKTGLSWAAVSKTVSQLISMEILRYGKTISDKKRGRDPEEIFFNDKFLLAGIAVAPGKISVCILDFRFVTVDNFILTTEKNEDPIPNIIKVIEKIFSQYKNKILSIGISFPGIIAKDKGTILKTIHFADCQDRNIREEIKTAFRETEIPLIVERNAVCDISYLNLLKKHKNDSILIAGSFGLSAAVLLDGQILHGRSGNIGEFGHIQLEGNNLICRCGRTGCLETVTGGRAWNNRWTELIKQDKSLPQSFFNALKSDNKKALSMLMDGIDILFPILSNLLILFVPEYLFLFLDVPENSLMPVKKRLVLNLEKYKVKPKPEIEIITGDQISSAGAALAGFQHLSGNPYYRIVK